MVMAYILTTQQLSALAELDGLISGQLNPASTQYWQGQAAEYIGKFYLAYAFLADVQTEPGSVPIPKPEADASAWLWFRGATQVNQGIGPFSTFIREYTKEQYHFRTGNVASD